MMKKAPELKLEIKRLRSVDLNKIGGGFCKAASYCDSTAGTQGSIAVSGG